MPKFSFVLARIDRAFLLSEGRTGYARHAIICFILSAASYTVPIVVNELGAVFGDVTSILIVIALSAGLMMVSPFLFLTYWMFLVLTQAWWTGFVSSFFDSSPSLAVTESKTVAIVVATIIAIPRIVQYLQSQRFLACAILLYFLTIVISIRDITPEAIAYARNFVVPFLISLVVISSTTAFSQRLRRNYFRFIVSATLLLLAIGSLAEHIVGTARWRHTLNADNQASLESLSTWTNFFGIRFERIGGLMVEPVTSGYVAGGAVVGAILLFVTSSEKSRRALVLLSASILVGGFVLISAATKASLLMVAIAVLAYLIAILVPVRGNSAFVIVGTWIISLAMILTYLGLDKGFEGIFNLWREPMGLIGGDSTAIHLAGLVYGIQGGLNRIFGNGLGVGGNFQRNFADELSELDFATWLASGSESGVGVLAYQLGLVGLIAFVLLLVVMGNSWGRPATVLLAVWSATSLLAESMMGPLVAALFFVGAALLKPNDAQIAAVRRPFGGSSQSRV
ncbi:hypothetical protein [Microbacterium gubbeenense]|uniref:hypothetical protein n=1 Tax=Microbacterium gubbeenense TaxID=159896 RepID=UPI000422D7ED|nr:hypothetical protein [Microbacterium gubbeenense]